VRADEVLRQVEAGMTAEAQERRRLAAQPLTFSEVARACLEDLESVRRAKPATIKNYAYLPSRTRREVRAAKATPRA
jgi:hypothetical protein